MSESAPERKPVALFKDLEEIPTTPAGRRDVAALDALAEQHGFDGGQGRGSRKKQATKSKPNTKKASDQIEVRRIGRPKTGRNVQFNQTVHPHFANAIYDYCRRQHTSVAVALEDAVCALLEADLKDAKRQQNQAHIDEIQDALRNLRKI
ncbi:MAG: hypothetical protein GDA50_06830 [Alphaproteobacteria bacterium GM202ARS2]|nr:hypothetical protein [Alphaproteobacteria bacterium GM202ARS2]